MAQPSLDNRLNGPFSTFEPAKSKELERDGWMGYRSFAVQHRRRFGCSNTSEGTVPKRQNPSKIRAQAQQKNSTFGGSKTAPLEPTKKKKRAPVRRPKTWRNLAWTIASMQLLGHGSETAKHHLNPSSGTANRAQATAKHYLNPSSGTAAETPPRARFRNGRTPARFELRHSKKQYVRRVQNSTFGAH